MIGTVQFNQRAPRPEPERRRVSDSEIVAAQIARDNAQAPPPSSGMAEMLKALTKVTDAYYEREEEKKNALNWQIEMQKIFNRAYGAQGESNPGLGLNRRGNPFGGFYGPSQNNTLF